MPTWEEFGGELKHLARPRERDDHAGDRKDEARETLSRFAKFAGTELARFLVWRGATASLAEDLSVDAIRKTVAKIDQFSKDGTNSFQNWVFTIATNCLREHKRKESPTVPLDDVDPESLPTKTESQPVAKISSAFAAVSAAIEQLSDSDRQLLTLRLERRDLTFDQIGDEMKSSGGTVRVKYHRLLKKLKTQLMENDAIKGWLDSHEELEIHEG